MANRRMFSLDVVGTDRFLEMPPSAQALYFHLAMRADDDGFCRSPRTIIAMANCCVDDLKLLIAKRFIIAFESGIIVIRDWKAHNYIPKDRYHPSNCVEKAQLNLLPDMTYSLLNDSNSYTDCIQAVDNLYTEVRIGKDRLVKDNNTCANACAVGDEFDVFWKAYPKRKNKAQAQKAFTKAIKITSLDAMLSAIEAQKVSPQWRKDRGQFIPYPATWLNSHAWEDELQQTTERVYTADEDVL